MARLVKKDETRPMKIDLGGESAWICACGLSNNQPYCDGSHKQCAGEEEGKLYVYKDGERIEVPEP